VPWQTVEAPTEEPKAARSGSQRWTPVEPVAPADPAKKWQPVAGAPEEPGVLGAGLQGVGASLRGVSQTGEAIGGKPQAKEAPGPEFTREHEWTEYLKRPGLAAKRAAYITGRSAPMAAASMAGGAIGTAVEPGLGTTIGAFSGAALYSAAESLGPYFYSELQGGKKPEEAWKSALAQASTNAAANGLSMAAFEIAPFAGAVKNLLFQAFVVQPAIAGAGVEATAAAGGRRASGSWGRCLPRTPGLGGRSRSHILARSQAANPNGRDSRGRGSVEDGVQQNLRSAPS
jgi:hypothetical protein